MQYKEAQSRRSQLSATTVSEVEFFSTHVGGLKLVPRTGWLNHGISPLKQVDDQLQNLMLPVKWQILELDRPPPPPPLFLLVFIAVAGCEGVLSAATAFLHLGQYHLARGELKKAMSHTCTHLEWNQLSH